jgi:hypothetical protein
MMKPILAAMLCAAIGGTSVAAPKLPVLAELKAYTVDDNGGLVPHTQDAQTRDVILAVKVTGATPGEPFQITFSGVIDDSAAYHEARKKAPPRVPRKVVKKTTLDGASGWVLLQIELRCYDDPTIAIGRSKLPVMLPGSCSV